VTMLVTSGSMIELATWQALGGFDEGLFIDYIDTDYCLRVIGQDARWRWQPGRSCSTVGARQSALLLGGISGRRTMPPSGIIILPGPTRHVAPTCAGRSHLGGI